MVTICTNPVPKSKHLVTRTTKKMKYPKLIYRRIPTDESRRVKQQ